jgi:N-methylhydantoinase A
MTRSIRLGVDVGGTFTDVALLTGTGALITAKVPSTRDQSEGVLRGIEKACRSAEILPDDIDEFIHSMTVSVNALLEETGARTALITTRGFRDILEIGRQNRPDLYDIDVERPAPLVPRRRRLEIPERATVDGIQQPIDESDVDELANRLEALAVESIAVCFLHAYAYPDNERRAAELLRNRLDAYVSVSHEVLAEFREYERTSTTVIDAYLRPELDAYLSTLEDRAIDTGLPVPRVMQANGGIAHLSTVRRRAVTTVMSGPAAGVVGARATIEREESTGEPAERGVPGGPDRLGIEQ